MARPETSPTAPEPSPLARLDATPELARQTIVYAVSGAIAPAVGIITLPILARVFAPSEYGLLELGMVLMYAALTLADLSLIAAAQRSFFDYSEAELEARRRVLSTALLASSAVTVALALALALFRGPVSDFLFGTPEGRLVALVAATLLPLNTFRFATEAMRVRFQARHYLVTTAITTIVGTALVVTFVAVLDRGVESVFVASLVANGLAALYGLVVVRDTIRGGFSRRELGTMLRYGLPLVPTTLLLWALALVDRVILVRLADLDAVGQYAIALRLAGLLLLAVNAFHLALGPFLFNLYSSDPELEKAARGRTFTYLAFVLGFAALGLTLFAREALAVLAPAFPDAYRAVGPLVFGTVGYGLSSLLLTGISLARRTIFIPFFSGVAAAVNIGLNIALIPPLGFVGAAFATGAGYVALAAFAYWVAQRVYRTPYEPGRALLILAVAAAFAVCGVLPLEPLALAVGVKAGAVVAFVVVVWVSRAMTRSEFVELARFLRGMVPRGGASGAPAQRTAG